MLIPARNWSLYFVLALLVILVSLASLSACINNSHQIGAPQIRTAIVHSEYLSKSATNAKDGESVNESNITMYDQNGHLCARYTFDSPDEMLEYKYSNRGNITEMVIRNIVSSDSIITRKSVFIYDDIDNIIECTTHFTANDWESTTNFDYDQDGYLVAEQSFDADGAPILEGIYKHDDTGNVVEYLEILASGHIQRKEIFAFDDSSKMIEMNFYSYSSDDVPILWDTISFDGEYKPVQSIHFSYSGPDWDNPLVYSTSNFSYVTHDEYGNWTKAIVSYSDEFESGECTLTRIIEYYEN